MENLNYQKSSFSCKKTHLLQFCMFPIKMFTYGADKKKVQTWSIKQMRIEHKTFIDWIFPRAILKNTFIKGFNRTCFSTDPLVCILVSSIKALVHENTINWKNNDLIFHQLYNFIVFRKLILFIMNASYENLFTFKILAFWRCLYYMLIDTFLCRWIIADYFCLPDTNTETLSGSCHSKWRAIFAPESLDKTSHALWR